MVSSITNSMSSMYISIYSQINTNSSDQISLEEFETAANSTPLGDLLKTGSAEEFLSSLIKTA